MIRQPQGKRIAITRLAGIMMVERDSIRRTIREERMGEIVDDGITKVQATRYARLKFRYDQTRLHNTLRRIERLYG